MADVRELIAAHGGIRPMARALGHRNPTTVQGWWQRNNIPADHREAVEQLPITGSPDTAVAA